MRRTMQCLLFLFICGTGACAHEMRPAYLQVHQTGDNTYDVFWKVPAIGDGMRLSLYVQLPDTCSNFTQPSGLFSNGAYTEQWSVVCQGGLSGSTIRITGLTATLTDVLVRIERLDGSSQITRLTSSSPWFVGGFTSLGVKPLSTDLIANFSKPGNASLVALDNVDQMCAIARNDWPPPLAGRGSGNSGSKLFTKHFLYFRERNVFEALWQEKRIAERTEIGLLARTLQVSEKASLVSVEIGSVQLWIEVNLPEAESSFCLEVIRM